MTGPIPPGPSPGLELGGSPGLELGGSGSERREYLDGGLVPVSCETCGYQVRAGRRSVTQTSVQWSGTACEQLTDLAGGRPTALVPTCPALRATLDRAIREGRLEVG